MKKLTKKQIVDHIIKETLLASDEYCKQDKKTSIPKSHWAFLHVGTVGALTLCGYTEKFALDCLEKAREELDRDDL